ncbi:unnamed protein product [Microthlaspi erraticum]|uniref:F-box domain-containing protein n=1 Tax=Microthlaspi erraticum TaxID=1685480 RepID=A0A6D2ITM4_9BRAS|nr:unnamed protein product [Microthlaspi erraticum]
MKNLEEQFSENLSITFGNERQFPSSEREHSNPIPVDLLIDIFSRLPRKSIDRFRCVSKFWGYILRRPDFTELFLTRSSTCPRLFFTVIADGKLFFYSLPQPQNPDDNSTLVATRYHTSFPEYFPYSFCSSVCGLVLLQGGLERKVRMICNPITGEFLTLPKVKTKSNPATKVKDEIARISLCYDPISKQFKVLCMTSSPRKRPTTHHQVLTLESGKRSWRRIECKFRFRDISILYDEICINGVLYFRAKMRKSPVIVCFDVGSEKFDFIKIDEDMLGDFGYCFTGHLALFNYKGKLGLRNRSGFSDTHKFVLWVVEDAGNHKWSKHTYELPSLIRDNPWFVGMTAAGETVWSSYKNDPKPFFLDLYNLERETFTRVNIQGFEEFKRRTIHTFLDSVENLKFV